MIKNNFRHKLFNTFLSYCNFCRHKKNEEDLTLDKEFWHDEQECEISAEETQVCIIFIIYVSARFESTEKQ